MNQQNSEIESKPTSFRAYIKQLREEKDLTVRQLAQSSGVSHSYITLMENGQRGIPSITIIKKLAYPLGIDAEKLLQIASSFIEATEEEFKAIDPSWITKYESLSINRKKLVNDFIDLLSQEL